MLIGRGEIWWASLPVPSGSEPGYRRPVLVVQSNTFNQSRIGTVVAIAITSNTRLAGAPGNVLLSTRSSGLPKPSVANVSQVMTLDRAMLDKKVKSLATLELARVEAGLRLVLAL
jgi:mRNA interferase MazF